MGHLWRTFLLFECASQPFPAEVPEAGLLSLLGRSARQDPNTASPCLGKAAVGTAGLCVLVTQRCGLKYKLPQHSLKSLARVGPEVSLGFAMLA